MNRISFKVGDKVSNRNKDIFAKIISIDHVQNEYQLLFENGLIKTYKKSSLLSKDISDREVVTIREGEYYSTSRYGNVRVVEYIDAKNICISFSDGTLTYTSASSLRRGNVGHPFSGVPVGYRFKNKEGCSGTVVEYKDPRNVTIEWELGGRTITTAGNIRNNSVFCPNHKSVLGVGYFGYGKYTPNKSGRNPNYNTRVYASWQRMLSRCYNIKEQQKPSCKAYINVDVCEEWHCFQNFAQWAEAFEDKFIDGWELDKDLFGNGKEYSPAKCSMLPDKVNCFLSDRYKKISGLPEGVNVIYPKTKNSKMGYIARCHINGVREYLGYFDCPEDAGRVYREAKECEAVRLAEEFKDVLTLEQYNKLINFTLEDIHRK